MLPSREFPAGYGGDCAFCGDPFDEGDLIRMHDDEPVCKPCGDEINEEGMTGWAEG